MRFIDRNHRNFDVVGSERRGIRYPRIGEIIVREADPDEGHPHAYPMRVVDAREYDGELGKFPAFTLRPPHLDPDRYSAHEDDEEVGWRNPPNLRYLPEDYPVGSGSGDLLPTRETLARWEREDADREYQAFSRSGKCPACGRDVSPEHSRSFDDNLVNPSAGPVSFHTTDPCCRAAARYRREIQEIEEAVSALQTVLDSI